MVAEAKLNTDDLYVHAHIAPGWTGQSPLAAEYTLGAGFSKLRLQRSPEARAQACIAFDFGIDRNFTVCSLSRVKIAVLWEPREINLPSIERASEFIKAIDLVLTHDSKFLTENPQKARPFWTGGSQLGVTERLTTSPKFRRVSISASKKKVMEGHRLRHQIISRYGRKLVTLGNGYRSYSRASIPYKNFQFSVVVENTRSERFFTEKLIHSLLFRCIPVYWGPRQLPPEIDESGIIRFESVDELGEILPTLGSVLYNELREVAIRNQRAALEYASAELNLQREVARFLQIPDLDSESASGYFSNPERLLAGKDPFRPSGHRGLQ